MSMQVSMMRQSSPQNVNRPQHWQPQMSTNTQMMNSWTNNNQYNMIQQQQSQNMATNYLPPPIVQMPYVCNQNTMYNSQKQDNIKQERWSLQNNESMHIIESDQVLFKILN